MYSIRSNPKVAGRGGRTCAGNPFCDSLACATRDGLCTNKVSRTFAAKREGVFAPLAEQRVMLICSGKILTYRSHRDGRPKGMECLVGGDILGIGSLFGGQTCSPVRFYVKEKTQACLLPLSLFEDLVTRDPAAARTLIRAATDRFARAINQITHVSLDSSEEKIRFVLEQILRMGKEGHPPVSLPMTHRELAIFAGINRITATRAIDRICRPVVPRKRVTPPNQ